MKPELSPTTLQAIQDLGAFALTFGRTNRITCHPDGVTPESDTDHTVMLGLIACAFAERFVPGLDMGKVAQFALVHDLVEVYAGDTVTSRPGFSNTDHLSKEEREREALDRIRSEFDVELPWLGETIEAYESLQTPEARYVKVIDKVMPKITNKLNKGATFKPQGHTRDTALEFVHGQREKLRATYGSDQEAALALLESLGDEMIDELFPVE